MIKKLFVVMIFALVSVSCATPCKGIRPSTTSNDSVLDLDSMAYLSTWFSSGRVTLSHGEYREAAAPGSASAIVVKLTGKSAFGTVNGKETGAVVLATDVGGTGTFYDLVLLTKGASGWENTDTVPLGDRVKVSLIEIGNDSIAVNMTMHGPGDPLCCPTLEVKKYFAVQGERLVPEIGESGKNETSPVTGTIWQWVQTLYNDGKRFAPSDPKQYTLQFRNDGSLNIRADCNLKGGRYSIKGNRLSIEITHSTMAACPAGSLEDQFVRDLTAGATYFLKDGYLYIDLKYDSGTMKLSRP